MAENTNKKENSKSANGDNPLGGDVVNKPVPNTRRIRQGAIGTQGIAFYQDIVNRIQPYELRYPQSMRTFEAMKNDDAISSVLNLNYVMIESAFSKYKVKFNKESEKSREAAKFVEWSLKSMEGQTFLQAIKNIETFKEKGFSIVEKVYKKVDKGEYEGMFKLKELAHRPQLSLDESTPFEIFDGGRKIIALRQNTQYFYNFANNNRFINPPDLTGFGYKRIPRKKFMLFGDNATDSTPFGQPLLRACYKAWKEKVLLEDLEINGASKDLAGIIELAVPADIIDKAGQDPSSPEAEMLNQMMTDAANIHSGTQSYFLTPSDLQDGSSSVKDYGLRLLGLEGGGKQFETSVLIQQRRKAIFDIWGAGHTITGEGSVSYNSSEVSAAIHGKYIQRDISIIESILNHDLIPQWLNVLNGMGLSVDDLPSIEAGEIDDLSIDELSKFIQRVGTSGYLPVVPEVINHILSGSGIDYRVPDDMSTEDLKDMLSDNTSNSGEGDGTSGVGSTQSFGSNSSKNKENS